MRCTAIQDRRSCQPWVRPQQERDLWMGAIFFAVEFHGHSLRYVCVAPGTSTLVCCQGKVRGQKWLNSVEG